MKIRIHHQELRFRLSPEDIQTLIEKRELTERIEVSEAASFSYTLVLKDEFHSAGELTSRTQSGLQLDLNLPKLRFMDWLESAEIEWTLEQTKTKLAVLIEKDLKPHRT